MGRRQCWGMRGGRRRRRHSVGRSDGQERSSTVQPSIHQEGGIVIIVPNGGFRVSVVHVRCVNAYTRAKFNTGLRSQLEVIKLIEMLTLKVAEFPAIHVDLMIVLILNGYDFGSSLIPYY